MSTVRLSRKNAQAVAAHLQKQPALYPALAGALRQLQDGLAPRRAKPIAIAARKAKAERVRAHQDETSAIYREVEKRADGKCEACGLPFSPADPPELDHQPGRHRAPQTVQNCWLIHARTCHRVKTNPAGGARIHLERFITHAEKHGFHAEAERARARLEGIVSMRERGAFPVPKVFEGGAR